MITSVRVNWCVQVLLFTDNPFLKYGIDFSNFYAYLKISYIHGSLLPKIFEELMLKFSA